MDDVVLEYVESVAVLVQSKGVGVMDDRWCSNEGECTWHERGSSSVQNHGVVVVGSGVRANGLGIGHIYGDGAMLRKGRGVGGFFLASHRSSVSSAGGS